MLPSNTISLIFAFGPSSMTKDSCWPEPPIVFASCFTVREGPALRRQHLLDDRLDLARLGLVVEGVDLDLRVPLLELVLDVRGGEVLRAAVVDDLDPLPLRHHEAHELALRAVGRLDPQVVEEARVPQPLEVVAQLALVVRVAGLGLDVEQQRLALQELVPADVDLRHHRHGLARLRLRPGLGGRQGEEQPGTEDGRSSPLHADNAPPRSPCRYQSPPSSTPTSIGSPLRMLPRMNASDSASSMWRWIARRSGRAP